MSGTPSGCVSSVILPRRSSTAGYYLAILRIASECASQHAPISLTRMVLTPLFCYTLFGSPQPDIRFGQRTANSFNCSEYGGQGFLRPALRPFARTAIQVSERVLFGNAWLPGPTKLRLRFAEFPVETIRRPRGSPSGTDRSAARPSGAAESPHKGIRESA